MILHRAYRDIQKCSAKYGDAWKEYERQVPYLFIPVSYTAFSMMCALGLTASSMLFRYPFFEYNLRNSVRLITLSCVRFLLLRESLVFHILSSCISTI